MSKRLLSRFFGPKEADESLLRGDLDGYYLPVGRRLGSAMTHRADIAWIEATTSKDGIIAFVRANPTLD